MFTVKIMTGSADVGDADTRKEYRLYSDVKFIDFNRLPDGEAEATLVYEGESERVAVPGNVYVMNSQGKTVSQFGAAPIPKSMTDEELTEQAHANDAERPMTRADNWKAKFMSLAERVHDLYFAAYWKPDRNISDDDQQKLWAGVRDAANIEPGQTGMKLGAPLWDAVWGEAWPFGCDLRVPWIREHCHRSHAGDRGMPEMRHQHIKSPQDAMKHLREEHGGKDRDGTRIISDEEALASKIANHVSGDYQHTHLGDHHVMCKTTAEFEQHMKKYHDVPPVGASEVLSESTMLHHAHVDQPAVRCGPVNVVIDEPAPFSYEAWETEHTADGHEHHGYTHKDIVSESPDGVEKHMQDFHAVPIQAQEPVEF